MKTEPAYSKEFVDSLLKACVDYRSQVDQLERENAALRSALTTLLAWEDKGGDIPPTAARGLFRIARAALDAARKEAQP